MHTHSQRLERWLGVDAVQRLTEAMRDWYGSPIALQGVPGAVYACKGGDFIGRIEAGSEVSALERADSLLRRSEMARRTLCGIQRRQSGGFADLAALQAAATKGKRREFGFAKSLAGATGISHSLWGQGPLPPAGADGAAAPGGTAHSSTDTGAYVLDDVSSETRHFVGGEAECSITAHSLLLYDRLFSVTKTMNDTATEAVTGVPTRYQSTTATDANYAGNNFLFVEVGPGANLPATAHNWTVCTYTDQGGNASTLPSLGGRSGATASAFDMFRWFAPLEDGDTGVKALTQMQCDALVATGGVNFVIGHPIAWMPCPLALVVCEAGGINTAFNFARVFDGACLTLIDINRPGSGTPFFRGSFTLVHS